MTKPKAKATAYQADLSKDSPQAFLAIGIGHKSPVRVGRAQGVVIGFKGKHTAVVQFGVTVMDVQLESFL